LKNLLKNKISVKDFLLNKKASRVCLIYCG
jgi:hypothetical protein